MTEELNSSPSEVQRTSDATPQRGTPTEDAASQRDTAGEEIRDPEKKRLHEEAVSHKKRAQDLEKQLKVYKDAEEQAKLAALSETEKATKRATDAEQRAKHYQERLVTAEVKLAAQSRGIIDPELAALAIKSNLEYGEDGMPTNLDKALDALVKNRPFLLKEKAAEPPVQNEAVVTPNTPTPPVIPAMSPGRTSIVAPTANPPGKVTRLSDVYKRP